MMAATDYLTKTEKTIIAAAAKREVTIDQVKAVLKKLRRNNVVDAVIAAVTVEATVEEDTLERVKLIDRALAHMKAGMSSRDASEWCAKRKCNISYTQLLKHYHGGVKNAVAGAPEKWPIHMVEHLVNYIDALRTSLKMHAKRTHFDQETQQITRQLRHLRTINLTKLDACKHSSQAKSVSR